MNILFFLKPKATITVLKNEYTLRQTIEVMERSGFTALPIIDEQGKYIGTVSEGDILWYLKRLGSFDLRSAEKIPLMTIVRHRDNRPIKVTEDMANLINMSKQENFIPVIDDRDMFIGIVTRQDIIDYFYKNCNIL